MTQPLTLSNLATFVLGNLKDENSGRVALYHYIKNFRRSDELLTTSMLNQFYAECLQMTYWVEKKSELHADITEMLGRFFALQKAAISLDTLWDLNRMQVMALNQIENLFQTVKAYENAAGADAQTVRFIPDGDSRIVVLKRSPQGTLTVRTYNNLVRVQGNTLYPLIHDQELFYNEVLELQIGVVHRLRLSPHSQVRFEINAQGSIAQIISGSAFRQSQLAQLSNLSELSSLFYPLKRLEKFYISRATDPYYIELISTLEKALELIKLHEPGSLTFARRVFDGAQIAFDQIFPDDKLVYLKLKELAKHLTVHNKEVQI